MAPEAKTTLAELKKIFKKSYQLKQSYQKNHLLFITY
jgi:hypothetical protein